MEKKKMMKEEDEGKKDQWEKNCIVEGQPWKLESTREIN